MPVLTNEVYESLMTELIDRYDNLRSKLKSRPLKSPKEGVKGLGSWQYPDKLCATTGSAMELSMAVEDFKTILAEIKKLK